MPSGIIAAIPTPFSDDGSINTTAYLEFAENLLANGCDGLNIMGTTGEATSLSTEERLTLMECIASSGLPLERMIVGTGASAVTDAIALTRQAGSLGFAGALVLPPFYYKNVSDEGVMAYVGQIVEATSDSGIPISLYHFPAMSAVPYGIELLKGIIEQHPGRIVGLKDSSSDLEYCNAAAALSEGFRVCPSNEASLFIGKEAGYAGCISATTNLNAAICARALETGDESILEAAVAIRGVFDGLPLVSAVKHSVSLLTGDEGWRRMRPPLVELQSEQQAILLSRLQNTQFQTA